MTPTGWLVLGVGAFVVGLVVGATLVTRGMRLLVAVLIGVAAVLVAWGVAEATGALASEGSEDLGPLFVMLLLAGNFVGWTVGVLLGSIWGMRRAGSIAGALTDDRPD